MSDEPKVSNSSQYIIDAIQADNVSNLVIANEFEELNKTILCISKEERIAEMTKDAPAISVAAYEGSIKAFQYLVGNSASIASVDSKNRTVAHFAAAGGHLEMIEYLDSMHANFNALDSFNRTPIYYACLYGHKDVIVWLTMIGINTEGVDSNGESLLHACALSGNPEVVEYMFNNDVDINMKSLRNYTPLANAIVSKSKEVVELFLARNSQMCPPDCYTNIFNFACEHGSCEICELLLDRFHFDINLKETTGWIPLNFAIKGKKEETCLMLIERGSIIDNEDMYMAIPLH